MKRKKLSLLTVPEIEHITALANFTELQADIFRMLCRDKSDAAIMIALYISNRRFYEEKAIVYAKIHRIIGENNQLHI